MALYVALGTIGLSMAGYSVSRPGKDGEPSSMSKWIDSYRVNSQQSWEERNTMRTNIKEQAAADKHLFQTVQKSKAFELRMPEYVGGKKEKKNIPSLPSICLSLAQCAVLK